MNVEARPKWIICANQIIMGTVEFHAELVPKSKDRSDVIGGGRFHWNKEEKIVYFYSSSVDFGGVTKEQFDKAWENSWISPSIEDCEIYFSQKEFLSDAMKERNQKK